MIELIALPALIIIGVIFAWSLGNAGKAADVALTTDDEAKRAIAGSEAGCTLIIVGAGIVVLLLMAMGVPAPGR
jgi:hypothetical protein